MGLPKKPLQFAQRTNLIAGGNATGMKSTIACDPEKGRIPKADSATPSGSEPYWHFYRGRCHGYLIQPLSGSGVLGQAVRSPGYFTRLFRRLRKSIRTNCERFEGLAK